MSSSNSSLGLWTSLIGLLLLCGVVESAHASICRVIGGSSPGGDGSDWTSQAMELQAAIADASCVEVWVAEGLYVPVVPAHASSVTDAERAISFDIKPAVAMYGGFTGTESSLDQRDPVAYLTILSGDIDGNDLDSNGNGIAESSADVVGSNSLHVVIMDGASNAPITASTVLDGFTITAGKADGNEFPQDAGGGLYCDGHDPGNECSPTLRNLVFNGNHARAGGAIYGGGNFGGASNPSLSHVVFRGNDARDGGAMFSGAFAGGISNPVLDQVVFRSNTASGHGGAMLNGSTDGGSSSPILTRVTFRGNSAHWGGAIDNYGWVDGNSSPILTNVTFARNNAYSGGAMYNDGRSGGNSAPILTNVTFSGNSAKDLGGAMYNNGDEGTSRPKLTNVIMWGNTAGFGGPEIYNSGNASTDINHSIVQGGCPPVGVCTDPASSDPLLGPLQDNGGSTWTMLPALGSPAIDSGNNNTCADIDQRGIVRPKGLGCDMGAVEFSMQQDEIIFADGFDTVSAGKGDRGEWYLH